MKNLIWQRERNEVSLRGRLPNFSNSLIRRFKVNIDEYEKLAGNIKPLMDFLVKVEL